MAVVLTEIEKQQNPPMRHPLADADADVRIISESCDLILLFFSVLNSSLGSRHSLILIFAADLICVF